LLLKMSYCSCKLILSLIWQLFSAIIEQNINWNKSEGLYWWCVTAVTHFMGIITHCTNFIWKRHFRDCSLCLLLGKNLCCWVQSIELVPVSGLGYAWGCKEIVASETLFLIKIMKIIL
jgi:hypothetical protein